MKKIILLDNCFICIFSLIIYLITLMEPAFSFYNVIACIMMVYSLFLIYRTSKIVGNIINFYNCYYLIWLFLIPLTSFSYPMMEMMDSFVWQYCLFGNCCFSFSIILAQLINVKPLKNGAFKSFNITSKIEDYIYLFILLISEIFLLYNAIINGLGVVTGNIKSEEPFFGYDIITTLGSLAIFMLFRRRKEFKHNFSIFFSICSLLYMILQILSGIRWTLILLILMCISTLKINKRNLKILVFVGICVVGIFMFANYFRRGIDTIELYYVQTGIYAGDVNDFFFTEIFRYFGMCQRLIEPYTLVYKGGYAGGTCTAYSFFKWFVSIELPDNIWVNGYNALNVIGYLWIDFGDFWPISLILWAFILCYFYRFYMANRTNSFAQFLWSISFMATILSFYCYMQHYTYWITLFPVTVIGIHLVSQLFANETSKNIIRRRLV